MSWTRRELEEAALRYENWLCDQGIEPERASRRRRSIQRFIAWLDGPTTVTRPTPHGSPTPAVGAIPPVPGVLADTVSEWLAAGSPPQPAIPWRQEAFVEAFPAHREFLLGLPRLLNRKVVQQSLLDGSTSSEVLVRGFIVAMAWGFGRVGYGAHRVGLMLATPQADQRLHEAIVTLHERGALAAYELLGHAGINKLGPAFGTKFLFFAQRPTARPRALIHDEAVSTWLTRNASISVATTTWSKAKYERYLSSLDAWATSLGIEPESVELCIFRSMANERGNQWSD